MKYTWRKGREYEPDLVFDAKDSPYFGGVCFPDKEEGYTDYSAGVGVACNTPSFTEDIFSEQNNFLDEIGAKAWVEFKIRSLIGQKYSDDCHKAKELFDQKLKEAEEIYKYMPE